MIKSINSNYPTLERIDSYPEFSERYVAKSSSVVDTFISKRNKTYVHEVTAKDRIKAGVGAVAGCILPMVYMMKKQRVKNPFNLHYGLTEMVVMSATSVAGGVAAGMIGENKETNKNKIKEGVFQFMNASTPAWVVGGALKLCESSKNYNNIPGKILAMIGGLIIGMYGAASVSNVICDPHDKVPDRKLTLLDCLVNIDDAVGVLVLAKFPFVGKLHLERALPFIYAYCGYRAGKSN